jgi:hypothetical protein
MFKIKKKKIIFITFDKFKLITLPKITVFYELIIDYFILKILLKIKFFYSKNIFL